VGRLAIPAVPGAEHPSFLTSGSSAVPVVLSFDVEEHHRIEAAVGLEVDPGLRGEYGQRMNLVMEWILEQLAAREIHATFFFVGQIAQTNARLVRTVQEAGHEVASHGWDHRRISLLNPLSFKEDLRMSKEALEQASGAAVLGYRAPTFSLVRPTAWALDVLGESGLLYDSSIYSVRHDRYGIPDAPRGPFLAQGARHEILEIPPAATLSVRGVNVPVGGGEYFRLLPFPLMQRALLRSRRNPNCGATMLYFHPWEFDPDQPRLSLRGINRFRTYVGIRRTRDRLSKLLAGYSFVRAVDLARQLHDRREQLPRFCLETRAPFHD